MIVLCLFEEMTSPQNSHRFWMSDPENQKIWRLAFGPWHFAKSAQKAITKAQCRYHWTAPWILRDTLFGKSIWFGKNENHLFKTFGTRLHQRNGKWGLKNQKCIRRDYIQTVAIRCIFVKNFVSWINKEYVHARLWRNSTWKMICQIFGDFWLTTTSVCKSSKTISSSTEADRCFG